jgi:RNase P subunit RPR2|tara:strand:- start:232 stop:429 length:198 start_codon:yes stop_codon:yes gene_type:complete
MKRTNPIIVKLKRKYPFGIEKEVVRVVCLHKWKEIDRKEVSYRIGTDVHVLLECSECGRITRQYV